MSFQDIKEYLVRICGEDSDGTLTTITNQVLEAMREW